VEEKVFAMYEEDLVEFLTLTRSVF